MASYLIWLGAVALLAAAFRFANPSLFKFVYKHILLVFIMMATSFYGCTISIPLFLIGKGGMVNYYTGSFMAAIASPLLSVKYKVVNEDLLHTDSSAVYIINHQSSLDLISMSRGFPKNAVVLAKSIIKWYPFLGPYMIFANNVFIDRGNRQSAIDTMANVAKILKQKNLSLFIYPEGTRSGQTTNTLLPFKKGAFHLAVQGQIPIIPIVFSSYHSVYNVKRRLFEDGEVTIKVLPKISTEGLTTADVDALIEKSRNLMLETLREISGPPLDDPSTVAASAETKKKE
ncbi:uncharacterized protein BJ171DRAFT_598443 [Polychytrium aggregatum]|uniref:uncharacterized protein n=1 Tax=Polychytrium aggregatum TaxID=110093 RepID=UPI0022FF33EC|nr:uncharacterized protein BJ171DRAFT_598443 [Polychytrium aggregatum]KAI9205326.1 hypothetical protein BJ171DRAFT_598443 [Polychytrium aggregatum]